MEREAFSWQMSRDLNGQVKFLRVARRFKSEELLDFLHTPQRSGLTNEQVRKIEGILDPIWIDMALALTAGGIVDSRGGFYPAEIHRRNEGETSYPIITIRKPAIEGLVDEGHMELSEELSVRARQFYLLQPNVASQVVLANKRTYGVSNKMDRWFFKEQSGSGEDVWVHRGLGYIVAAFGRRVDLQNTELEIVRRVGGRVATNAFLYDWFGQTPIKLTR